MIKTIFIGFIDEKMGVLNNRKVFKKILFI